jgi:hypothetical protein
MIQAVRLTHYRTKDGAIFSSRDEAHRHEIKCAIMETLRKVLDRNQCSTEELELAAVQLTSNWSPVIVMLRSPHKESSA